MFAIGQAVYYVKSSYGVHTVENKRYNTDTQQIEYKLNLEGECGGSFWTTSEKVKEIDDHE